MSKAGIQERFHNEVLTEKLFCFMPTSCSRCRANIIMRRNFAKQTENFKSNNNKRSWSLVFIWICEKYFSVSPQWTKRLSLGFNCSHVSKASFWPTLVGSVLKPLLITVLMNLPSLPSPDPPHVSQLFVRGWGRGFVLVWVNVLIAVRKMHFRQYFIHESFSCHSLSYC